MSKIPDKKPETPYVFWTSAEDQQEAMDKTAGNIESYDGILSANASRRSYLDIEPNISVRTEYLKDDYYRFRRSEQPGQGAKQAMSMCMRAYEGVGIIKNVIDLMGDFGAQGISLHHPNKKAEKFYRTWWEKVQGSERSERFLNLLYRSGNVVLYKRYGKITKSLEREMTKADDVSLESVKVKKRQIPLKYDFINPLCVDVDNVYTGWSLAKPQLKMKISGEIKKAFRDAPDDVAKRQFPPQIREALEKGEEFVLLDPQKVATFFYKKDDWEPWANPMINAIIDDVVMLEKMKLADMSALDGAISNVRLWKLGSLDHKVLPNKAAIDKLRNILASNVGGGTMDLVWGPEISYQESATQIYKFLGTEKYQPVLNSIYAGLGIPPTLTGLAGQSGGFTNNFISLKTLIERLEYGRDLLNQFWMDEIRYVQKAMGFKYSAEIHFDNMVLSDEAAEKNLLIQLADRDIISTETLRDRFGELNNIENVRVKNESKQRNKKMMPPKADPYHNANVESEYKKIALQKGEIGIQDVTDLKLDPTSVVDDVERIEVDKPSPNPDGGRPKFSLDQGPRKQKRVLPKNSPNLASLTIWTTKAQEKISQCLNSQMLDVHGKKNLRELSKSQLQDLEELKFTVLCKIDPYSDIDEEVIKASLPEDLKVEKEFLEIKDEMYSDFVEQNQKTPSIDEMRQIYNLSYSFRFFS
jgi:hypothetical protein